VRSVSSPFRSGRLPFTGSSELIGLFLFGTIALAGGFGARWALRRLSQS
jgi:hypothetical protein